METPEQVVKQAKPFFLSYFQKLASDLNTLIDAPVVCQLNKVALLRGEEDLNALFELDRSVAYAREDGLSTGDVHLVFDVTTSIALAGLMMMMGESVIKNKLEIREYNDEIKEGFQEVSNQIVGALNDQIEAKMADGGHLLLESTKHIAIGNFPDSLNHATTYLAADVDIRVSGFGSASAYWLLSRGVAKAILDVAIPGSSEEEAQDDDGPSETEQNVDGASDETPEGDPDAEKARQAARSADADLPEPDEEGSVKVVMTETAFAMKEDEPIKRAVVAMLQDGYRYIAVERKGVTIRIVSQSDLRQVMGPFYGSQAVTPRDKALFSIGIGKLNENQKMVKIVEGGTVDQAAELFVAHQIGALPVVSNKGIIRGFVPMHAVIDYFRKRANRK